MSGTLVNGVSQAVPAVKRVPEWFTGERDLDGALKNSESILTAARVASDSAAAAVSLSHLVRDLFGIAETHPIEN